MAELRTFIFTDIVRSVALKSEMEGRDDTERDRAFVETILTPHRERIDTDLADLAGRVVSTAGDGHFLVFSETTKAALWAINVQRLHLDHPIRTPAGSRVDVRISMHLGTPQVDPRDPDNFVGKPVDYAARLNDFAQGGQVLCSRAVAAILDDIQLEGVSLHAHGKKLLRGIGKVEVYEVVYREAGPMETVYHPAKVEKRQWTVIPPGPAGRPTVYPAAGAASGGLPQATLQTQARRLGNYEIQELLGSGGMGDVYKARHTLFDRVRAIKVIKQRLVESGRIDLVRRFYQEIKAIGKLDHKNIVVALESSTPEDRVHYLVMEYIDGISLDDLVLAHGPLSAPDACEAIRQAARGLDYIYKYGMVHRDIKPSNLMLTTVDAFRVKDSSDDESLQEVALVKILDLGLALLVDEGQGRLTQFGQRAMGTGMYMSPEQWKSPSVDIRADIYSLGCTLYHLLAGHPPFMESDLKPEKAHEKSKVPPIKGPTEVPRKLWDVIKKMLAKNPDDRFQMPAEVVTALAPFCTGHNLVGLARKYSVKPPVEEAFEGTPSTFQPNVETLPLESGPAPLVAAARKKRRGRAVALLTVLAVLVAAAIWFLRDPRVVDSPEQLARAADLVVTLPGMNGLWWFEETPWLTPGERVRMLTVMRESDLEEIEQRVRAPDVQKLYDKLGSLTTAIAQSHPLSPQLQSHPDVRSLVRDRLAGEMGYDPLVRSKEKLDPLIVTLEGIGPNERTPVDAHLLGVLYTHLQDFDGAEKALSEARRGYQGLAVNPGEPTSAVVQPLLALVWSDLANLNMAQSHFPAASQSFDEVGDQLARRQAVPIHAYALGMQSQAGLNDPDISPDDLRAYLSDADRLADQMNLADTHPLRAFLHERRAHLALETWRLPDAIEQANLAAKARNTFANLESQSSSFELMHGSHHAQQGWFRAKQIEALAVHFQGRVLPPPNDNRTEAREAFHQLLNKLQNTEGFDLTDEERITWEQLKPNFYGRTADCELFAMGQFEQASATMRDAILAAEQLDWQTNPEKRHFLVFMHYKRAIALALAGKGSDARIVLDAADDLNNEAEIASRTDRFQAFRRVADALLRPTSEHYVLLGSVLLDESQNLHGRMRDRDTRQIMLFVAAYLRELLDANKVSAGTNAPVQGVDQLNDIVKELLAPLRRQQKSAGTAYQTLLQRSAHAAVELQ